VIPNLTAARWNAHRSALLDLREHTSGFVNVRSYGAKGDGVTDDATAIQAADTAAGTGGRVFFPEGTYIVGTALAPSSNRTWFGEKATLKRKAATNVRLINASNASAVTLDGLTLDGNKANQAAISAATAYGNVFTGDDITVRNCTITGFSRYPLRFDRSSRVVVRDSVFDGGEGAAGVPSSTLYWATDSGVVPEDFKVINNRFFRDEPTPRWPVLQFRPYPADQRAKGALATKNVIVIVNGAADVAAIGIEVAYVDGFSLVDNWITGGAMGISIAGATGGVATENKLWVGDAVSAAAFNADHKAIEITNATTVTASKNVIDGRGHLVSGIRAGTANADLIITENQIFNLGSFSAGFDAGPWGISSEGSTGVLIAKNIIDGNLTAVFGVYVNTSTGVTVSTNEIRRILATGYGIRAYASARVTIESNQIPGAPDFPIYVRNTSRFKITKNTIEDGDLWGIYADQNDGTSSIGSIEDNLIVGAYASAGVLLKEIPRVSVTMNRINTSAGYGVALQQATTSMPFTLILANSISAPNNPPVLATVAVGGLSTTSRVEWMWTSAPSGGNGVPGMRVIDTAAAESGTAGTKYTRTGWRCVTYGTPGTWVEERSLTGN
jgi:hypothetical protein